jgi:hypothetical protein
MAKRRKKTKRTTAEEREQRIDFAQEVYTRTLNTAKTALAIEAQFGITRRHARNIIRQMRDRWEEEAVLEGDIEDRRTEMRMTVRATYERAMRRRVAQHNADGTPAFYPKGHPREGQLVTTEQPDLQLALRAAEYLARLDGLFVHRVKLDHDAGPAGLVDAIAAMTAEGEDSPATLH